MTEEIFSRGHPCTYVQDVLWYGVKVQTVESTKSETIKENFEARSPKYETNNNDRNTNVQNRLTKQFGILVIRILTIVSSFDIRNSDFISRMEVTDEPKVDHHSNC